MIFLDVSPSLKKIKGHQTRKSSDKVTKRKTIFFILKDNFIFLKKLKVKTFRHDEEKADDISEDEEDEEE